MESQLEEINEVRKDEQLVLPENLDYMRYYIIWSNRGRDCMVV